MQTTGQESNTQPSSKHLASTKAQAISPFKGKTGLRRLINAAGYSLEGFKAAFKHEDAFRQEVFLAIVLIPLAFYLGKSPIECALMVASVLLVLIVELLNSAIEAAVDHTSTEQHALAKQAKDIGSAAVFCALVILATTWGLLIFA
jgi:diacylglycerol kinase (ATP)